VEDVVNRVTCALEGGFGVVGGDHGCAAAGGVESELDGDMGSGGSEVSGRALGEDGGDEAVGLDDELALFDVKAVGEVGFVGVGVFAGEGVKIAGGWGSLRGGLGEDGNSDEI
jgi:hypothetical protein